MCMGVTRADAPSWGRALATAGCWQPLGCALYNRPIKTKSCMGDAHAQWLLAYDQWPGVHGDKVASKGVSGFERRCLGLAGGLGVKKGGVKGGHKG